MQKELSAIVDSLSASSYNEVVQGLAKLESFLGALAPSIRKYHKTGLRDSRLASLAALQDHFQYNVAAALLQTYQTFVASPQLVHHDHLILANHLLSGMLLIHSDSRVLFGRSASMALMLSFLEESSPLYSTHGCISFVSLLIHILLKNIKNMRTFEANNGCQLLIRHLKLSAPDAEGSSELQEHLHFKVIEFMIFYLTDESDLLNLPVNSGSRSLSIQEKADLFRPEFPAINDLIDNLNDLTSLRSSPAGL